MTRGLLDTRASGYQGLQDKVAALLHSPCPRVVSATSARARRSRRSVCPLSPIFNPLFPPPRRAPSSLFAPCCWAVSSAFSLEQSPSTSDSGPDSPSPHRSPSPFSPLA